MPTYENYPVTGCRPAQLLGIWSIEPQAFEQLQQQALIALSDGQLEVISRQSRELVEEERQSPYDVDADGVAHFSVTGPLTRRPTSVQALTGGTSTLLLEQALRKAAADEDVKGAMLHIDSPGGHSSCAADIAAAVRGFAARKPIASHINGMGTSLAYRLAIETVHVSMDPAGMTGSVGTLMELRDTSELFKRAGVKPHYIATGDRKAVGGAGQPITDAQLADMRALIGEIGESFATAVKDRRPQIGQEQMEDVLRAGLYAAPRARSIGLVDSVADTETAIENFKQSLSTGSRSLPVAPTTLPAAAQTRSSPMALTAEQLAQAKALPGCTDISAENADGKLLAAATSLQTDLTAKSTRLASLEAELANAKAAVPQATPPAVLKAMASAARVHLGAAKDKQAITPAVAEALASSLIGTDDNLSATGLTPDATGECVATKVFAALASNGPSPRVGQSNAAQQAPKAVPGAPDDDPKPITAERKAELLAMSGAGATK